MSDKIVEPIYIYLKDTGELRKFKYLKNTETGIESYDINNYEAFDSTAK